MKEIIVRDKNNKVVTIFTSEQGQSQKSKENIMQNPNVKLTENGEHVFTFSMLTYAEKWKQIKDRENTYEVDGRIFKAIGKNAFRYFGNKVNVTAVELWYELRNKYTQAYNVPIGASSKEVVDEQTVLLLPKSTSSLFVDGKEITGNPYPRGSFGYNAYAVLYNSGWKLGICDVIVDGFNAQEDYGCFNVETDMKDILYNLEYMRSLYGGVFVWDSKNKILNIRDETKTGSDFNRFKGFEIREGKNMSNPEIVQDNHIVTRLFPFGENNLNIKAINNGKTYLENFENSQEIIEEDIYNKNIYDQKQLKFWGQQQLEKLSKPRETINVNFVDLRNVKGHETDIFKFLDIVSVVYTDKETKEEVTKEKRLISVSYNPLRKGNVITTVGDKILNQQEIIKQALETTDRNAKRHFSSGDVYDREYGNLDDFLEENDNFTAELRHDVDSDHAIIELNTEYISRNAEALANFKVEVTRTYATIDSLTQFKTATSNAITSINQRADANSASINSNTKYTKTVSDALDTFKATTTNAITSINQRADANSASIRLNTSYANEAYEYAEDAYNYAAEIELQADKNGSRISMQADDIEILSDNFYVINGNLSALSGRFDYLSASIITADEIKDVDFFKGYNINCNQIHAEMGSAWDFDAHNCYVGNLWFRGSKFRQKRISIGGTNYTILVTAEEQ